MAVTILAGNGSWTTYALLDTGAQTCAINRTIAKKIGLELRSVYSHLTAFNYSTYDYMDMTSFTVTDMQNSFQISVVDAVIGDIMTTESELRCTSDTIKNYKHMSDIEIIELDDPTVGLLLSSRYARHYFGECRKGNYDEPIAIQTDFGWAVLGPVEIDADINELRIDAICSNNELTIEKMISYMYHFDFIGRPTEEFPPEVKHPSQFDEISWNSMNNSVTYNESTGHYKVSMPWRYGREKTAETLKTVDTLGYTRNRQRKLKEKFLKDETLRVGAFKQIQETIESGHARIVTEDSAPTNAPVGYLANHIVLHDDKPGKFRITQDTAARVKGHRFSDLVLTGPDLLAKLVSILFNFRRKKVVLSADIKSFFFQIEMDEMDAPACRYLWWADAEMTKEIILEPRVYNMGIGSSVPVSLFTMIHHADEIKEEIDIEVFIDLIKRFYMDDYLNAVDTVQIGSNRKKDMIRAMSSGGFELTKWKSNYPELNDPSDPIQEETIPEVGGAIEDEQPPPTEIDYEDSDDEERDENAPFRPPTAEEIKYALNQDLEIGKISDVISEGRNEKILGVGYSFTEDVMFLKVGKKLDRTVKSKRELLAWISSMFDPLGIIAPFILKGRLYFQLVNMEDIEWNDQVPDHVIVPFNVYKDSIVHLTKVKIPRWTSVLGLEDCVSELLICCDASASGYGIVAYVRRHLIGDNEAHVAFYMGKSHVVPLQMLRDQVEGQQDHGDSIPRLELVAARLAAIWRDIIVRESGETFDEVILFSDSTTVLSWIFDWTKRFKTFENFRLKMIRILTLLSEWLYIHTRLNPADLSSKGIEADDEKSWNFYHTGPEFFRKKRSEWETFNPQPEIKKTNVETAQLARVAAITLVAIGATKAVPAHEITLDEDVEGNWPLRITTNLSVWSSKVRRVALVRRFFLNWIEGHRKKKGTSTENESAKSGVLTSLAKELPRLRSRTKALEQKEKRTYLSLEDSNQGEKLIILAIQAKYFERDIVALVKLGVHNPDSFEDIKKQESGLLSLSPFLDEENLLRAGGRLKNALTIPYESRYPMILPRKCDENLKALIRHYHVRHHHCSASETFFLLRQKFFFLGGRRNIHEEVARCVPCQTASKLPAKQKMGNLPADRVNNLIPFATTGADVFGPYALNSGRYTKKRWVILFTCFTTRAICMYSLKDMTLSTTVNAIVKLSAQYPTLHKLVSDNGTNFKGANREINEAMAAWDKSTMQDKMNEMKLVWEFGPAHCGHWGGLWERMIKVVKSSLTACMGRRVIDLDTFDTLLAGITGVVNRRPLTKNSNSISEPLVLTPMNLIFPYVFINRSSSILPPEPDDGDHLTSQWLLTRKLLDDFWARFRTEYIQELITRPKWKTGKRNVKVDDIVLLVDEMAKRENWRMCRITEVIGTDPEHVRRVKLVDSAGTTFDRHVEAIVPLEFSVSKD